MSRTKDKARRKPLATLSEEDRLEYAMRNSIILQRQMEYNDIVTAQTAFRGSLIEKYGLPSRFDLTLETGDCWPIPEGSDNAQNGSV